MKSPDDRITDLEIALTHQQRYLDELNGVVLDLSHRLESVTRELALVRQSQQTATNVDSPEESDPAE